jgi:hypothetical protein
MRRLLICIISLLPVFAIGQVKEVELAWIENDSLLSFSSAAYHEQTGAAPIFTAVIPWHNAAMLPSVKVEVDRSSVLSNNWKKQVLPKYLSASPKTDYQLVFENRQPKLQISLLPFFMDPTTGKTMRLESFSLHISEEPPMAKLKSQKKGRFTGSSMLASNNWYKISVETSGIHKLTYENLQELGIGNPAMVKIYGAGAILLPEDYSQGNYDDLSEIPVYINKGSDQLFGPGDYLLFYARGPVSWNYDMNSDFYSQQLHTYSERGFYFLTDGPGIARTPAAAILTSEPADATVNTYDLLEYLEEEKFNLLGSGREWYGDKYEINLSGAYPFTLNNLVTSEPMKIRVTAAVRSNEKSSVKVSANNSDELGTFTSNTVNLSSSTSTYAIENSKTFSYTASQEVITIQVEYLQPNSNSEAWLNHITINGRARMEMTDDQLVFRDSRSVGNGNITEFRISNISANTQIWEITDPDNPQGIPYQRTGSNGSFRLKTDQLREFIAFESDGSFPVPGISGAGLGKVANQNLHGTPPPEMIIIHAEEFGEQASRLAEHRRSNDNLSVGLVTQQMIFNEFSSGTPDVTAIRNYLKMYYDDPEQQMVQYLLLFGDGSYDNRDTGSYNPNLILTYQSANSLSPTSSYVSDDFFGLLDTGEGLYDGMLDIGIGRLPASTIEEAELLVDKLIAYDQPETFGDWRNYICFIGDDEDGNIHMRQANSLASTIEEKYPDYNINKIFLDAYPQESTPTGDRYPDVTRAINDQMNRGALIINYTGHGGVTGLAHEKILEKNHITSWRNTGKYPLFMTATCEFSRYDDYDASKKQEVTTAGEEVLLNPRGGSIALFTTTRLVYSGPNHVLNEKFYERVFEKRDNGDCYRLGDIIMYSKNEAGAGINKRNFTLLGDPSTSLSFPQQVVVTDSINHQALEDYSDTLSALEFVTISGHLQNRSGELLENFNGSVIPIVYDKKTNLKTLSNDGGSPMDFQTRNSTLYKGNATVESGRFTFSFYVPKDIGYSMGDGKISYYGYSEDLDAHGSSSGITIGGLGDFAEMDTIGPELLIYMNDSLFRNGGIVNSSPELLVYVKDPYGINTTGNGIGHDITATLNDDRINAIILNEYYRADADSYSSGSIRYPYDDLPEGKHSITVKVWDIFNNSATGSIDFIVVESSGMLLEEIYNYPNPFIDETFFNIEHNRPGQELEVVIRIYDLSGNLVSVLQNQVNSPGFRIDPPSWQGKSMGGATLGGGLYVYKVVVKSEQGEEAAGTGRLIIKR